MSIKGKRLIYVGRADNASQKPHTDEGVATVSILAGSLLASSNRGFALSSAAGDSVVSRFLVADKDQHRTRNIDEPWTAGENMIAIAPKDSDFLNVRVAAGNNFTDRNVGLSSNGDGQFKIAVEGENVLCYSAEIIDVTVDQTLVRVSV